MNMRILSAVKGVPSGNTAENMSFEDLRGFVCFVPSVIVGTPLIIKYSNALHVRYSSALITKCELDDASGIYTIETDNEVFEVLDLEHDRTKRRKRIASTLYMESRIRHNPLRLEEDPEGHLYADGKYRTKIFASDLPEYFVYGYMYKRHGFISAAGVKHMLYVPNYVFNHRYKDDSLYISYDAPIQATATDRGLKLYEGWDHVLGGRLIVDFVEAAEKYSGYDATDIRAELKRKSDWYDETFGKDE